MATAAASTSLARRRFGARGLGWLLLAAALLLLLPQLRSGTEMVRVRNALALGDDLLMPAQDWQPPAWPRGWKSETVAPAPFFVAVAERLKLADEADDWQRALAISRHLLSAPRLNGGAIQQDLLGTYRGLVERGDGYCGDFIRAFAAIASAAGLPYRTWAFSFDGFGGHGHIWVEIWNRQAARWQLLDVFDNYYFVDGSAQPLSALELRRALIERSASLRWLPLHAAARPGFAVDAKAWAYFRNGLNEWYMPWGSNPHSYDAAWPTRLFGGVSRAAESLGAALAGEQPGIRILATPENDNARGAMQALRLRLLAAALLGLAGLVLLLAARSRSVRGAAQVHAPQHEADGWPRLCLVGPLPPPSGGMANQCEQLQRLLRQEGAQVELVRTNAPYRPAVVGRVPFVRAGFRLLPYLFSLWRAVGRAQVVHVMANSGWAWHLLAAPALGVARLRGVPAIVNYRGGQADEFLARAPRHVVRALAGAHARITPSAFLLRVFRRHGLAAEVIPNIIDLSRFTPRAAAAATDSPHLIVTRNLEPIYDIPTALRAFAALRRQWPRARLTVAGSGPERAALERLTAELGLAGAVRFAGRIDNADIAALYASADLMLNPSTADNMPISILEALASGVPVVSTAAGGIPDLVEHGRTALLVPVGDDAAMGRAALRLLAEPALALGLRQAGIAEAARYAWPRVREQWQAAYWSALDAHPHPPPTRNTPDGPAPGPVTPLP